MWRVEVPRCDIDGMEYYKIPRDVFESAYRTARNPTAAAKRIAAVVEYAFTGDAELVQNGSDSAAFLLQFRSRIDRSRANAFAALLKGRKSHLTGETMLCEKPNLYRLNGDDLRTDKRREIGDYRENLTITSGSGGNGAVPLYMDPPTERDIINYGRAMGYEAFIGDCAHEEARKLIRYNEQRGWVTQDGEPIFDYRGLVALWNDRFETYGVNW